MLSWKNTFTLLLTFMFLVPVYVYADYDYKSIEKIRNDKEALISSFDKNDIKKIKNSYKDETFNKSLRISFYQAVQNFLNTSKEKCEFNLIVLFIQELKKTNTNFNEELLTDYLRVLRINNDIDDILYEMAIGIKDDYFALKEIDQKKNKPLLGIKLYSSQKVLKGNDIHDLYTNFDQWPDEKQLCAYQEFVYIKDNLKTDKKKASNKDRLKFMKRLNKEALKAKLISAQTYKKLEYFRRKSFIKRRYIWLEDYFDIIFKAKNKMLPYSEEREDILIEKENQFASERIKRFSRLTRRKLLYEKYGETQIILLAQVLQKASRRMGTDPDVDAAAPYIVQEFQILNANGEKENYVERIELDPQSQYNLARKRMRKDILDLQVMDIFYKSEIHYSDIIMAALETGYITHEEIQYVVGYDDLWNPHRTKFQRVKNFVFNTARVSTFFIPPPFNISASIALMIVEGVIDQKTRDGADNDNPATYID